MRARYVSELAEGSRVDAAFVVSSKEMRVARNGEAYLVLTLADRTGAIPAVYFRPSPAAASVPTKSVVQVQGTVTSFKGAKRVSVESMVPAVAWEASDFLSSSARPSVEVEAEFTSIVRSISDTRFQALLERVFGDKPFYERFRACPASAAGCRVYLGGLLEHTIAVAELCDEIAKRYPGVERDLLLAAALLHDIGRVDELEHGVTITVSDEGRLLGHVALGLQHVAEAAVGIRIERTTLARLEHAILVHHGSSNDGEFVAPATTEALVLCRADEIEREADGLSAILSGAVVAEEAWTGASNRFGRALYAVVPDGADWRACGSASRRSA